MGSIYTHHPQHPWPVYNYTSSLWLADIYKPFVENFCPSIQHVVGFLNILWHAKIYENSGEYVSTKAVALGKAQVLILTRFLQILNFQHLTWEKLALQCLIKVSDPFCSVFQASILLIIIIITSRIIIMYFLLSLLLFSWLLLFIVIIIIIHKQLWFILFIEFSLLRYIAKVKTICSSMIHSLIKSKVTKAGYRYVSCRTIGYTW